jgi:hypothetical protein
MELDRQIRFYQGVDLCRRLEAELAVGLSPVFHSKREIAICFRLIAALVAFS